MKFNNSPSKFQSSTSSHRFQQLPNLKNQLVSKKLHTQTYQRSPFSNYNQYTSDNKLDEYTQKSRQRMLLMQSFQLKDKINELLTMNKKLQEMLLIKNNQIDILNNNICQLKQQISFQKSDMEKQQRTIRLLKTKVFQFQQLKQQLNKRSYPLRQYNRKYDALAYSYEKKYNYLGPIQQKSFNLSFQTNNSQTKYSQQIIQLVFQTLKNTVFSLKAIVPSIAITSFLVHLNYCQNIIKRNSFSDKRQLQYIKHQIKNYKLPLQQIKPIVITQNKEDELQKIQKYQQIIEILSSTLLKEEEYILKLEKERNAILQVVLDE